MANPEIILLGGPPGSGKTTIGERFVEMQPVSVPARHLSIGTLKRQITSGERSSSWASVLDQRFHSNRKSGTAHSAAMIGIMEEFIEEDPNTLLLLDGFPAFPDRVEPFKVSMRKFGANVLALCEVRVTDDAVLLDRLEKRDERPGQKIKDPVERLAIYHEKIAPTLDTLAESYPRFFLDGMAEPGTNALAIASIYEYIKT